jgi:hypothetical protein
VVVDGVVCVVVDGAACDVVDGADWVGAGAVVDDVPAGLGIVGVCAQTGAAIARATARAVPLKSCLINLTSDMTTQAKPSAPHGDLPKVPFQLTVASRLRSSTPEPVPIAGDSAALARMAGISWPSKRTYSTKSVSIPGGHVVLSDDPDKRRVTRPYSGSWKCAATVQLGLRSLPASQAAGGRGRRRRERGEGGLLGVLEP